MARVRSRKLAAAGLLVLAALALAATAGAVRDIEKVELRAGDLLIVGRGGFKPETLPKHRDAPIKIYGGGKVSTISGELPPILDTIEFEFDRHGHVDTTGIEVCTAGKLQATDVPAARKQCPNAIVGKGFGRATVAFPEQAYIPVSSPITAFNGPKKGGNDTILFHAFTTVPVATTFIVPVVIEKINNGIYGYRVRAKIPKIAGGYGHPVSGRLTVERKTRVKGKLHSYVNARCENGRLQARGKFVFKNGTRLTGTFFRPCKAIPGT
ncbi:MAG TPA: hypothetical protein VFS48_06425 [Solirubrobacterales bacterium]|nr:hypothetical protein [Solirubrobacterales bacterium]